MASTRYLGDERSRVISAAEFAALSDVNDLTADRVEALVGGHGMLNLSVIAVADVITEALENGGTLKVTNANTTRLPMEDVLEKCIAICRKGGCDAANAALISAVMMYLAGSAAQVGIPAGNRKLGALARLIAGNDRCGVSNIPTAKTNNKLSGFPAVAAIYKAMCEGTLIDVDGHKVPGDVLGSAFFGHGSLGEDYVYPQLAANGARLGTRAMMDAYYGAGMPPNTFECAIFGAAAVLEIVHPDAEVGEDVGPYGTYNSAAHAGRAAAEEAGLPPTLHMRATHEEWDTGRVIGDLGLILKDAGGPSVIGMMAIEEIFSCFEEGISGASAAGAIAPLGHICGYAVVLMKALQWFGTHEEALQATIADRLATSINPECALESINILARKAQQIKRGTVTDLLIQGTDPMRHYAIHRRCEYAYDQIKAGVDVTDVVRELDRERVESVCRRAGEVYGAQMGERVEVRILDVHPGARRKNSKIALKYLAFDGYFDVEVSVGERHAVLHNVQAEVIPKLALGEWEGEDVSWAFGVVNPVCEDQLFGGSHLDNVVVPAAMSALLGQHDAIEAADLATDAAVITAGIPGCKPHARRVASLARRILEGYDYQALFGE